MLCLTRRAREALVFIVNGLVIFFEIIKLEEKEARIEITAPRNVVFLREKNRLIEENKTRLIFIQPIDEDLVLTIGGQEVSLILQKRGKQLRVSITAAREVTIHREEVWRRIQAKQEDGKFSSRIV